MLLVLFSYRDSALLWNCFAISLLKHDIIWCCSLLLSLHRLECSYEPYRIRSNQAWTPQIRRSLNETVYAWITRIRLHYWYIVDRYSGIYDYVRCISRRCQVIIWQMTSFFCRRVEHAQDMRYIIMDLQVCHLWRRSDHNSRWSVNVVVRLWYTVLRDLKMKRYIHVTIIHSSLNILHLLLPLSCAINYSLQCCGYYSFIMQ